MLSFLISDFLYLNFDHCYSLLVVAFQQTELSSSVLGNKNNIARRTGKPQAELME